MDQTVHQFWFWGEKTFTKRLKMVWCEQNFNGGENVFDENCRRQNLLICKKKL